MKLLCLSRFFNPKDGVEILETQELDAILMKEECVAGTRTDNSWCGSEVSDRTEEQKKWADNGLICMPSYTSDSDIGCPAS
jgi:hypothetical protein